MQHEKEQTIQIDYIPPINTTDIFPDLTVKSACELPNERCTGSQIEPHGRVDRAPSITARRAELLEQRRQKTLQTIPPALRSLVSRLTDTRKNIVSDCCMSNDGISKKESQDGPTSTHVFRKPIPLAIYKHPPKTITIDLWTYKKAINNRLEVLQSIYRQCGIDTTVNITDNDSVCRGVESLLESSEFYICKNTSYNTEIQEAYEKDRLSHFFLRLAFADDSGGQEWFIKQECRLLQIKLRSQRINIGRGAIDLPGHVIEQKWLAILTPILKLLGIEFELMSQNVNNGDSKYRKFWDNIISTYPAQRFSLVLKIPFWPFAAPLARRRRCYLENGYGYIILQDIEQIIIGGFRRLLVQSFTTLRERRCIVKTEVYSDPRLGPLFCFIQKNYLDTNHSNEKQSSLTERLTLENIEKLSLRSFPPCMKQLYFNFKKTHHLRHWGRLQLWLFLKGCGMGLDEQLHWWRSVWSDGDRFDKEIRYNIRHAYGQEGKRVDYPPFNCSKIISGNPSPGTGDFHGCPFRHFDSAPLKQFLSAHYKLPIGGLQQIIALKESHEYQLACVELFKTTHSGIISADGVGNSPNAYFVESCRCSQNLSKEKGQQL